MRTDDITIYRSRRRTGWLALLITIFASIAAPLLLASSAWLQAIGAVWLGYWAHVVCALLDRMGERGPVVVIDEVGIHDTRLLPRPIEWSEIELVYPVDPARSQVVELQLRDPHRTLAEARWSMRIGLGWHRPLELPEVCISLVLLDGTVSDVMAAIRWHAPHLLPRTGRSATAWRNTPNELTATSASTAHPLHGHPDQRFHNP